MSERPPTLTDSERARYEWQLPVTGFGEAGQARLKRASVLISRCGGLGSVVAYELAAAGLGRLLLAHAGNVKASDLNRQILMTHEWLGRPRLECAARRLRELNPDLAVEAVAENVSSANAERLVAQADLVVDCAPLFEERFALNRAAVRLGKPMVECAVYELEGHITTFVPGQSGCLRCLYPEPSMHWQRQFPVFGAVSGTVGSMGAMEAIKLLAGFGKPLAGELLAFDLRDMTFRKYKNPAQPGLSGVRAFEPRPTRNAMNQLCLTLLCLGLVVPVELPACRYNVRDVGFADLTPEPYHLFAFVGRDTPAEFAEALRRNTSAMFNDANVEMRLVESLLSGGAEAEQLAREHRVEQLPAAILAAPDGRSLVLPIPGLALPPAEAANTLLNHVISSPGREAVLMAALKSFAVVLLVEGADARQNQRARAAANAAIAEFSKILGRLPKQVLVPPSLQIIPVAEAGRERVLLWSIGVTNETSGEPAVAVLHGRGRLIGPVLMGGRVTEAAIFRILNVVGQDCECDLDRAWLRGPRFPARWGTERQAAAVQQLGFDTENPLVKAEMKGILDRGASSAKPQIHAGNDGDAALLGYKEVDLDGSAPTLPVQRATNMPVAVSTTEWTLGIPLFAVGALGLVALVALAGGLFIFLKRRSD